MFVYKCKLRFSVPESVELKSLGAFQLTKVNHIKFPRVSSLSAKVTKTGFFPHIYCLTPLFIFYLNTCQVSPALTIIVSITKARQIVQTSAHPELLN